MPHHVYYFDCWVSLFYYQPLPISADLFPLGFSHDILQKLLVWTLCQFVETWLVSRRCHDIELLQLDPVVYQLCLLETVIVTRLWVDTPMSFANVRAFYRTVAQGSDDC